MEGFNDYQRECWKYKTYPENHKLQYLLAGITSELGELATLEAKYLRGDPAYARGTEEQTQKYHDNMKKELGDLLWFVAMWASELDIMLHDVAVANLAKLQDRKERGVIKGDGDNR